MGRETDDHAAILDLDGTLTNSELGIVSALRYAMERLGFEPPKDSMRWCIGPPIRETFSRLLGTTDEFYIERAVLLQREYYAERGWFENTLYPEIPQALRTLRGQGFRTYVATSKAQHFASRIIDHFQLRTLINVVYGAELDGTRSDKAELLAYLLKKERLSPERAVMIGDRKHDAIGAHACGIPFIGVAYGFGTMQELIEHQAIAVARTPSELPRLVRMCFEKYRA